jgi:FkbM family methyltransferase
MEEFMLNLNHEGEKFIEQFKEFIDDGSCKLAIYGGNLKADFITNLLRNHYNNEKLVCYVVSSGYKTEMEKNGLPVFELNEIAEHISEYKFIIATQDLHHNDIITQLNNLNNNNYQCITDLNMFYLNILFYNEYFNKKNVSVTEEYIDFKSIKTVNPIKYGNKVLMSYLYEIGDLILPSILKENSRVFEGPYEYLDVRLKNGDVVIDCGANMGLFSSVAAVKNCLSYAFEPIQSNINILEDTVRLYPNNIVIAPYALADSCGEATFSISGEMHNNSMVFNEFAEKKVTVPKITLDEFVNKNNINKVDFIKADIEGAERLMLAGAQNTLKKFAPKLSICTYHFKDDPEILEKLIKQANNEYTVVHKWGKLYAFVED